MDRSENAECIAAVKKAFENAYNVIVEQLSTKNINVAELGKEKQQLLSEIEKMKLEKDTMLKLKKENCTLHAQLQSTRKELYKAKSQIEFLTERLHKERIRVTGWKKFANRLDKNEPIGDVLNKLGNAKKLSDATKRNEHCLFQSPEKPLPDVDIYAPMTEQYNDDHYGGEQSNSDMHLTVGETEHPQQHDMDLTDSTDSDNNNDESEISSPSILTRSSNVKESQDFDHSLPPPPQFFSPNLEIIRGNNNDNFDTSDDLFAGASPLLASTCISGFKVPSAIDKSTPCSKTSKQDRNKFAKSDTRELSIYRKPSLAGGGKKDSEREATLLDETKCESSNTTKSKFDDKSYKYVEVIRKKADREQLNGYTCHECMKYYESDNLTKDRMQEILKQCSRHRHQTTPPPGTPDDFWSTSFPSTQEYIKNGFMGVEGQKILGVNPSKEKSRKRIKYQ